MARGDIHWFAAADEYMKKGDSLNLSADTIKVGIVTSALTPAVGLADPRWGAGGSNNFSANEVATHAGGYTGPVAMTNVTYTRSSGVNKLDWDDFTIPMDASGFSNGAWGIIYDDTDAGKHALGYIDLGGPVGNTTGPLVFNMNAAGVLLSTAS